MREIQDGGFLHTRHAKDLIVIWYTPSIHVTAKQHLRRVKLQNNSTLLNSIGWCACEWRDQFRRYRPDNGDDTEQNNYELF